MTSHASIVEVNFDCLVGPTHQFGGLSLGNLASLANKAVLSNPKKAALQGLKKMKYLADRGFVQAVLPPHPRPHYHSLNNLGFVGEPHQMLKKVYEHMPEVFFSFLSSSAMWAANAATISPSKDTLDGKVHITPANLITMLHRSIEAEITFKTFKAIFADERYFFVHDPLIAHDAFSDEGAANHNRLTPHHGQQGLEIFVYGKESITKTAKTRQFPCRQSRLANDALIRRHKLNDVYALNIEQNPSAIDAGVFHNDVVCVVNQNVMLCHEAAFSNQEQTLMAIKARYSQLYGQEPIIIQISENELPLKDAVASYLFNSQLLSKDNGYMMLFAPLESKNNLRAKNVLDHILAASNPIDEVVYFDVSESMANGGGPACLRLRVLLTKEELLSMKQSVLLTDELYEQLGSIIDQYYVEDLKLEHFFDKNFLTKSQKALAAITKALGL